jgi:hypothetical protein
MAWIDIINSIGKNNDMNDSMLGIVDKLFQSGNYKSIVQKLLDQSGASRTISPYYKASLIEQAQRLALQSMLEDVAAGKSAEESFNPENIGSKLSALMSTPGGLGWKRSRETLPMYSQALANISSWADAPEGTQARALFDFFSTPEGADYLKGMGLAAIGPGYGGAFNSAYTGAFTNWFNNQKTWEGTDNPEGQTNFWNTLSGVFGGLGGQNTPSPLSGTPNMRQGQVGVLTRPGPYTPKTSTVTVPSATAATSTAEEAARAHMTPPGSSSGNTVNSPAEAEALYNKPENRNSINEGSTLRIGNINYKATKGQDGSWHLIPEYQYDSYRNGSQGTNTFGAATSVVEEAARAQMAGRSNQAPVTRIQSLVSQTNDVREATRILQDELDALTDSEAASIVGRRIVMPNGGSYLVKDWSGRRVDGGQQFNLVPYNGSSQGAETRPEIAVGAGQRPTYPGMYTPPDGETAASASSGTKSPMSIGADPVGALQSRITQANGVTAVSPATVESYVNGLPPQSRAQFNGATIILNDGSVVSVRVGPDGRVTTSVVGVTKAPRSR